jgi:hypothetical protein
MFFSDSIKIREFTTYFLSMTLQLESVCQKIFQGVQNLRNGTGSIFTVVYSYNVSAFLTRLERLQHSKGGLPP